MTQLLSSSVQLNREQIETTVNNLATCRHFTSVKKIFEGKPSFSDASIKTMKTYGIEMTKVTKFADNYIVYRLSNVKESESTKKLKRFNPNVKVKNMNPREEIVIVVESDKFDKQHYLAIAGLYQYFADIIDRDNKEECLVSICPSNLITQAIAKHFDIKFIPCNYRVFSLCEVYPLIGSKSKDETGRPRMFGYTKDYEVIEYEDLYNKAVYPPIYDSDPIIKIFNARAGDLIVCNCLFIEGGSPYWEYAARIVTQSLNDAESVDISGLNLGDYEGEEEA